MTTSDMTSAAKSIHTGIGRIGTVDIQKDGTITLPGGFAVVPISMLGRIDEQMSQCLARAHSRHLAGLITDGAVRTVGTNSIFSGIRDSLKQAANIEFSKHGKTPHLWEFQYCYGQIRRGILPGRKTMDARCDMQGKKYTPDQPAKHPPQTVRRRDLASLHLPEQKLINPVSAYLAPHVSVGVGCVTAAPISGWTWRIGHTGIQTLAWSGHSNRFDDSRVEAMLEGIERNVGAYQSSGHMVMSSADELPGCVITPEDFASYPEALYNNDVSHFNAHELHEWVLVEHMKTGETAWMPREYVYYGEPVRHHRWAYATSSGCATGSDITEASLFGLLELIERDAFVSGWYACIPATRLNWSVLEPLSPVALRASLLGYHIECGLLSSATGIPVVVSCASSPSKTGTIRAFGASCQPDIIKAVTSAVQECWMYLPERIRMARMHFERVSQLAADPKKCQTIDDHTLLSVGTHGDIYDNICGTGDKIDINDIDDGRQWMRYSHSSTEYLLEKLTDDLADQHIDVWRRVQTSPFESSCELETVMMVSPQLVPIDFGWSRQRAWQSERLTQLIKRHHGVNSALRTVLHPFS